MIAYGIANHGIANILPDEPHLEHSRVRQQLISDKQSARTLKIGRIYLDHYLVIGHALRQPIQLALHQIGRHRSLRGQSQPLALLVISEPKIVIREGTGNITAVALNDIVMPSEIFLQIQAAISKQISMLHVATVD